MKLLMYPVRFLVNKKCIRSKYRIFPKIHFSFSLKRKFRNERNEIQVRQSSNVLVEEADNQLNILNLPEELLVNIMEYLDILDIIK